MKKRIILLAITIFFLVINSCDFIWECIDGNGIIEIDERDIEGFDGVVVAGAFDVTIRQDNYYLVEIETDENLMPFIITEKERGNLKIKTPNHRCLYSTRSC